MIGYDPVIARIIKARFRTSSGKTTVIQTYAPTASSTEEEIDEFYMSLQTVMNSISNTDLVIIMSDFNAKVGRDRKTWHEAMGKYGYGETNDRGERLLQFCLCNCLMIMNSVFYQEKTKRRWTWESPDGTIKNIIYYIMVNRRWKNSVSICRSFPLLQITALTINWLWPE